ncbi:hypothetical protein [Amniculibacterium aquaticum]|jgi:hypothetical protein|uniref:hypothetical protein n=1 Tax=Amniculibacterium aquaticum TaxID=2479858 RepID=UPI000F5A4DF4|nr:hypothetical protein [Amniculibacterium aquaticum]
MRKLFLVAALGVAGLMSAKEKSTLLLPKNFSVSNTQLKLNKLAPPLEGRYIRVTIKTTCGKEFSQIMWFDTDPDQAYYEYLGNMINFSLCGPVDEDIVWDIN